MLRKFISTLIIVMASVNLPAQVNGEAKEKQQLQRAVLNVFTAFDGHYNSAVASANDKVFLLLTSYLKKYYHNSDSLKIEGLNYSISPNKKLRLYTWNAQNDGTQRVFNCIAQYKTDTAWAVKTLYNYNNSKNELEDSGYFFDTIYNFNKGDTTFYLTTIYNYSPNDFIEGVKIIAIENGKINLHKKLIQTSTGLHNSVTYEHFPLQNDYHGKPWATPYFDAVTTTFFIPVVVNLGRVTDKYIKYHFDGQYFVKE